MPQAKPCPSCGSKRTEWLQRSSQLTDVNYFRCEDCYYVWWITKAQPEEPNAADGDAEKLN